MDKPRTPQGESKARRTTSNSSNRPGTATRHRSPSRRFPRKPTGSRSGSNHSNNTRSAAPRSGSLTLTKRWLIFIQERFSPLTYIPMIFLFVAMNGSFGTKITTVSWLSNKLYLVTPLILSFFFRMRLFDEIKDYQADIKVNPTRPLPRGLLRINQLKKMILALILIELPIAGSLGLPVFFTYVLGLCYSLLMYNEFFLSDVLKHRLTTYAVLHTFVSVILGTLTSVALVGLPSQVTLDSSIGFFLSNWALFNLFEFARKSFAAKEERENVPTYSGQFGIVGAWALSISQILLTHESLYLATQAWNLPFVGITISYIVLSLFYVIAQSEKSAIFFRQLTSVVLLLSEISILYWLR